MSKCQNICSPEKEKRAKRAEDDDNNRTNSYSITISVVLLKKTNMIVLFLLSSVHLCCGFDCKIYVELSVDSSSGAYVWVGGCVRERKEGLCDVIILLL